MKNRKKTHESQDALAVKYLKTLSGSEVAINTPLICDREDGYVLYWRDGAEVRSREVTKEKLPAVLARFKKSRTSAVSQFSAELAGPTALDRIETAVRDRSYATAATVLVRLLEDLDSKLTVPACSKCGGEMKHHGKRSKGFVSRLGPIEVNRSFYRCRVCGDGHFPLDRAVGLEGKTCTPGAESMIADLPPDVSYEALSRKLSNIGGIDIAPSTAQRLTADLGKIL